MFLILGNGLISKSLQNVLMKNGLIFEVINGRNLCCPEDDAVSKVKNRFESAEISAVFSLFGYTNRQFCSENLEKTRFANIFLPKQLALLCQENDIPFIFASSSAVFSGKNKTVNFSENYAPNDEYGTQKVMTEIFLRQNTDYRILRFGKVWGKNPELLENWKKEMTIGNRISAFENVYISPITSQNAALALFRSIEHKNVILQLSASFEISYYTIAQSLRSHLELRGHSVREDLLHAAKRNSFSSHDSLQVDPIFHDLSAAEWKLEDFME